MTQQHYQPKDSSSWPSPGAGHARAPHHPQQLSCGWPTRTCVRQPGALKAALSKAGSLQPSCSASSAEEWTDPLTIAAMELMQRGQLISQSSAIASALQARPAG